MPAAGEILDGLTRIANDAFPAAVGWHVVVGIALLALALGWRPSRRLAGLGESLALLSVSAFAWAFGNPFNGTVFALLAAVTAGFAVREHGACSIDVWRWSAALGVVLLAFGWSYPHFLEGRGALAYLYGSPMGLVPCPTLSVLIGFALLGIHGGRSGAVTLALAGTVYALIGAVRLGVAIDGVMLAGAAGLFVQVRGRAGRSRTPEGASPASTPREARRLLDSKA